MRISTSRTRLAEGIAYGVSRGLKGLRFPSTLPRARPQLTMEGQITSLTRYHHWSVSIVEKVRVAQSTLYPRPS